MSKRKKHNFELHKHELMYIGISSVFILFWLFILVPFLDSFHFHPFIQFVIFNIGVYAFFFIFLKTAISKTGVTLLGALGIISLFLAVDFWMPDYHVLQDGTLLPGAFLGVSSSDYVFGLLATNVGLSGIWVWVFAYIIAPLIFLMTAAIALPNFVKKL